MEETPSNRGYLGMKLIYIVFPAMVLFLFGYGFWSLTDTAERNKKIDDYLFEKYTTNQTAIQEISCRDIELAIASGAQVYNTLPKSIPIFQDIGKQKNCVFSNSHWWDV